MNKELREDLEHILICKDKTITQDLRDDIKMTLDYIDDLEDIINKEIDTTDSDYDLGQDFTARDILYILSSNKIN